MLNNDNIFNKIADALLIDYTSIYYVDAVTNEYLWYSSDPEDQSVHIEKYGDDFFASLISGSEMVICDEDKKLFSDEEQKELLLARMKEGTLDNVNFRVIIDGKLVYYSLRLIRGVRSGDDHFILGVRDINDDICRKEATEKVAAERDIYNQISYILSGHYDTIYYINMFTDHYFEFTSTNRYESLNIPKEGDHFFDECARNCERIIHPDDQERVLSYFSKDSLMKTINSNLTVQYEYRIIVNGEALNMRYSLFWARDKVYAIICLENIDDEIRIKQKYRESQLRSAIYGNIAESLAQQYDVIYYVNINDGSFIEFNSNTIYDHSVLQQSSSDFFKDAISNIRTVIHPKDRDRISKIISKEYIKSTLDNKKQFSADYRMIIDGNPKYTRITVSWSSDRVNLIIGIENIDEEVKREREQRQALSHANELARRDTLTGAKNKLACQELENAIQKRIDSGADYISFGFVVCDIIGLKVFNEENGRKAGDNYICAASRLICNVFKHSPVFRLEGGKFAVYLGSSDFLYGESLLSRLKDQIKDNMTKKDGPVLACGMALYEPSSNERVSDVLARADSHMCTDKTLLKSGSLGSELVSSVIPVEDKRKLDTLFDAFSLVSEGSYIYICDMRYDFSKWSKKAVELFGLPSEYMYRAGEIWENVIHPDDKETYRNGISDIFTGNASGHDMQYRAKKLSGTYDVCTCRGIVLRDQNGKPEYFCGAIRNHSIQEHIDSLTGLRNQYGFFEDLQTAMTKRSPIRVYMVTINKFSEINEVYGYNFGNVIIQKFGRYMFEYVGNTGHIYRLDGTKFAVISKTKTADEIRDSYEEIRDHFRKGISIDGNFVILDLSAALLSVENFDIDYQTVYACLNFAYGESKVRRQGDMVEFYNDLNADNKYRLEKLYAIRASIMQNYKGFYLMYQPMVDASNEKLVGAEALLRWRSEEYGMVPPDHFIPILEKDPLFSELGQWILRTAINGAKIMMEEHPDFVINVNLSYTQLEKPDFVDMVLRTLKEEGFPPEHLCLEITERCRLLDMNLLKNVIVNLRGRGILIALDDFGTGFSSIGILKNLPFDTIKIDRGFVRMIEQDQKERDLIRSFVSLAATFGAKICVEGVETAGMRDILQQYNIQSFQGYYYGKPLELREFILKDHEEKQKS